MGFLKSGAFYGGLVLGVVVGVGVASLTVVGAKVHGLILGKGPLAPVLKVE
jgi:hypothetical protein